ncbi:SgcJ/EcaC family oxidoreductase [Rhizobium helianthi]|uniref:SgcJ/EcaC family oxidoreductase n=1 Tax=Rhizobium helianthi TaxID=1132695 RepID=A0ABW4M652_9HYPH
MKKAYAVASLALVIAAGGGVAAQAKTETCEPISKAQVENLFNDFNKAWATKDSQTVTALFAKEPLLLPTLSNKPRSTPDEVKDYFDHFLKNSPSARIDTSTIEIDCHTASNVGTWTISLTDPATGKQSEVKGRYSFIYRFEDGQWKIDHLHSSLMPEK